MTRTYAPSVAGNWPPAIGGARRELGLFSMGGIGMLLIGILTAVPVTIMGRAYVGEVMLGIVGPVAFPLVLGLRGGFGKLARTLLIAMVISWLGYIGSDLYRGSAANDYLRGWFRWIVLISNYATLAWLGSKNIRYVIFYLLGWGIGMAALPLLRGGFGIFYWWKFYAGFPACLWTAYIAGKRGPLVATIAMLGIGAASILLDSRAMMLTCLLTAGISFIAGQRGLRKINIQRPSKRRIVVALATMAICGGAAVFFVQKVGEKYGYAERFERSNLKRWTNIEIAYSILKRSPIIGYGSWPRDPEIARIRDKIISKQLGGRVMRSEAQENLIIVHSQVLQAWVEGGLIGLAFFLVYGWNLAEKGFQVSAILPYEPLLPVIIFVLITAAWHFFASPIGGLVRIVIIVSCAMMCYLNEGAATNRVAASVPTLPWHRTAATMPNA